MKTIIIYESLHGSTEKCAKQLTGLLQGEVQTARLAENENILLDIFDTVIVGGSIHNGMIQTRVENFIKNNGDALLEKKTGFYLCCMEEGETARMQFEKAYPEKLRKNAIALGLFGGEFNLKKMSFFEKKLTKKITGIKKSVSKIKEEEIKKFAEKINTRKD